MYGLIPQTFCAENVAAYCDEKTGRKGIVGDGDPLDICVLAEKTITMGGITLEAIPIGGLRMLDGDEADDKIIAVMKGDAIYGTCGISTSVHLHLLKDLGIISLHIKIFRVSSKSRPIYHIRQGRGA